MAGKRGEAAASRWANIEAIRSVRDGINALDARVDVIEAETAAEEVAGEEKSRGSNEAETAVRNGAATAAMADEWLGVVGRR